MDRCGGRTPGLFGRDGGCWPQHAVSHARGATLARCRSDYQELKAELDFALAALARLPDVAPLALQRLLAAIVPQGRDAASQPALPHYDLGYQLNEIEVRRREGLCFAR